MIFIHKPLLCFVALSLVTLAGCSTKKPVVLKPEIISIAEFKDRFPTRLELEARLIDTTNHSHSNAHGNQVEYFAADKKAYLWYPGNSQIVIGEWKVEEGNRFQPVQIKTTKGLMNRKASIPNICYRYGANTFNPVTGQKGGAWDCESYAITRAITVADRQGDIFNLSQRPFVPYIMTEKSIAETDAMLAACPDC